MLLAKLERSSPAYIRMYKVFLETILLTDFQLFITLFLIFCHISSELDIPTSILLVDSG